MNLYNVRSIRVNPESGQIDGLWIDHLHWLDRCRGVQAKVKRDRGFNYTVLVDTNHSTNVLVFI